MKMWTVRDESENMGVFYVRTWGCCWVKHGGVFEAMLRTSGRWGRERGRWDGEDCMLGMYNIHMRYLYLFE